MKLTVHNAIVLARNLDGRYLNNGYYSHF